MVAILVRAENVDQVRDDLTLVAVPVERGYEASVADGVLEKTPKVVFVPVDATECFLERLNCCGRKAL